MDSHLNSHSSRNGNLYMGPHHELLSHLKTKTKSPSLTVECLTFQQALTSHHFSRGPSQPPNAVWVYWIFFYNIGKSGMPSKEWNAILLRSDKIGCIQGGMAVDQNAILIRIFLPCSICFSASTTTFRYQENTLFTLIVYYATVVPTNNSF